MALGRSLAWKWRSAFDRRGERARALAAGLVLAAGGCSSSDFGTCAETRTCGAAATDASADGASGVGGGTSAGGTGSGGTGSGGAGSGGGAAAGGGGGGSAGWDGGAWDGGPRPAGAPCASGGECASGVCADAVCCETPCDGACVSCAVAGSAGQCTFVPAGEDPGAECVGSGAPGSTCAGACDGAGGCTFPGAERSCSPASCAGTVRTAYACGADGACVPVVTDCDDGLACTGQETCTAGGCVAGPAPSCTATDFDCTASCEESAGGGYTCKQLAKDVDGDQHGTTACAPAPGDDCDDTLSGVHPAAAEACNGSDDDCDGLIDLDDGVGLGGVPEVLVALPDSAPAQPDLAWSTSAGLYGVTWDFAEVVFFVRMSEAGARLGEPVQVSNGRWSTVPSIAAGGDEFAVAWNSVNYGDGGQIRLQRYTASTGVAVGSFVAVSADGTYGDHPSVVALPAGGWAVVWKEHLPDPDQVWGTIVSAAGVVTHGPKRLSASDATAPHPRAAVSGSTLGVVWGEQFVPYGRVQRELYSTSLSTLVAEAPVEAGSSANPVNPIYIGAAGGSAGFGASWVRRASELAFGAFGTDGVATCGPASVTQDNKIFNYAAPVVVRDGSGFFVLAADNPSSNALITHRIYRFTAACAFVPPVLDVSAGPQPGYQWDHGGAAASPNGYAAVWYEDPPRLMRRVWGKAWCD